MRKKRLKYYEDPLKEFSKRKLKKMEKSSSKGKKVKCFNYGGLRHIATYCPSPKDSKNDIWVTWSDVDSNDGESQNSNDGESQNSKTIGMSKMTIILHLLHLSIVTLIL